MDEKKTKMFDDIKQRLTNCENDICFFDDLRIDCTDDNKYICKSAQVKDDELIVTLAMPNGNDMELRKDELDIIAFPNVIFNAITWTSQDSELMDEIKHKLVIGYESDGCVSYDRINDLEMTDGNHFDLLAIFISEDDCVVANLFSEITGEFNASLDDFTIESLQTISDNLLPPKTILVEAQNEKAGITLFRKDVKYNTTEEEMLDIIQKVFPTFKWEHDDDFQFVYYPKGDGDITDEILATLSD